MIKGTITENMPLIQVLVAWGQAVQAPFVIIDTGFTGDLQVTPEIANGLGLKVTGIMSVRIANGQVVEIPTALAIAVMEGAMNYVDVLISDSMPLIGIGFLSKFYYKTTIDCKHMTVNLEKV